MLRIRDGYHPGSESFPFRIRIKEFKYFNPKNFVSTLPEIWSGLFIPDRDRIRDPDPDFLPIPDPGSTGLKGPGVPDPDPQHWFLVMLTERWWWTPPCSGVGSTSWLRARTGSRIRLFSIPDPHQRIYVNLTQKIVSKLSEVWSGLFFPDRDRIGDPDPDFFTHPGFTDPGVKKAPDPGSATLIPCNDDAIMTEWWWWTPVFRSGKHILTACQDRIPDPTFSHSGSASKNHSIVTPKNYFKLWEM